MECVFNFRSPQPGEKRVRVPPGAPHRTELEDERIARDLVRRKTSLVRVGDARLPSADADSHERFLCAAGRRLRGW